VPRWRDAYIARTRDAVRASQNVRALIREIISAVGNSVTAANA